MRDVFSELSDDVLVHILSFLPTLDSVQTLLLRRFGDLWTLVPKLEFLCFNRGQRHWFMIFVRHVMLLHQAPVIHTFILKFHYGYRWDRQKDVVDEIQTWIKCVLHKEPELVFLDFSSKHYFPLPHCFFLNQSLVEVCLQGCRLKQRRHKRVHMGSLSWLILDNVIMDESEDMVTSEMASMNFNEIISGCPSLETLDLTFCNVDDIVIHSNVLQKLELDNRFTDFSVNLSCPNVKILHLSCSHILPYKLLDISSAYEATIRVHSICYYQHLLESIKLFYKSLQNVEILTLDGLILDDEILPQNRWKTVTLKGTISTEPCIVWICDLVKKSPILEELTIMIVDGSEIAWKRNQMCPQLASSSIVDGCEIEWKRNQICPQLTSPCIAPHLREVHIVAGKNYDDLVVLQFIEFFLKSAVVLVELVISPSYKWGERVTERLTKGKKKNLLK